MMWWRHRHEPVDRLVQVTQRNLSELRAAVAAVKAGAPPALAAAAHLRAAADDRRQENNDALPERP